MVTVGVGAADGTLVVANGSLGLRCGSGGRGVSGPPETLAVGTGLAGTAGGIGGPDVYVTGAFASMRDGRRQIARLCPSDSC